MEGFNERLEVNTIMGARRGFTLTEVLVAVIIFGIVISTGFYYFVSGAGFIEKASRRETALRVASNQLETLKDADYSSINNSASTINIGPVNYDIKITVNEITGMENYKEINVGVEWDNYDLFLDTIIAE